MSVNQLNRLWHDDQGVLTFEWILLATVLVIGVVAGVSAVRDAIIDELGDMAEAVVHINQSFQVLPNEELGTTGVNFVDNNGPIVRSGRSAGKGQSTEVDRGTP